MIELEKFPDHLQTLKPNDWDRLFMLLPEIETTSDFGKSKEGEKLNNGSITTPYWNSSEIVDKTFNAINNLNLYPKFDWIIWEEGKNILSDTKFDYVQLDTIVLCKLLTTIIRADRFSDGYFIECFQNGVMQKIIKALKNKIQKATNGYN